MLMKKEKDGGRSWVLNRYEGLSASGKRYQFTYGIHSFSQLLRVKVLVLMLSVSIHLFAV